MVIIAGCLIVRDNKVLMVKEAHQKCYGKWNFPAGHIDVGETIMDAAIRETFEETGCKIKLTGVLPICVVHKDINEEPRLMIKFTADVIEENIVIDESEILEVKWIDIDKVKNMSEEELRGYDSSIALIKAFEENKIYPLEVLDNNIYTKK